MALLKKINPSPFLVRLMEELQSKQMILELVEDDIREFEEKLVELRRAYLIRLV